MEFIEIEAREMREWFTMSNPQFHDYYELYFLFEGERELFVENRMFRVTANSFCVLPPFCMHKTEGEPYMRVNMYLSSDLLTDKERVFLNACGEEVAFSLEEKQAEVLREILLKASGQVFDHGKNRQEILLHYAKGVLHLLQTEKLTPLAPLSGAKSGRKADTTVLKVVSYINENYAERITLKDLGKRFFLSLNTLCARFQAAMNCSVGEYLSSVRLNKAKMYLLTTKKGMEEIAELCGFSSANYFGQQFKRRFGCSPMSYRKIK